MTTNLIERLPEHLRNLPPKQMLLAILQEQKRRQDRNKLSRYKPYPKQVEFHNAGANKRERLFRAGNQLGKTWSSAYEVAFHLTGMYPDWWKGKRWNRAVTGWALGESMESTRDTMQRLILGRPGEWGTGTIPAELLIGEPKRAQGIADSVDCIFVRHISGGVSRLYFKSYEKGRSKLQGETLDFAALDEEPPLDIYTEVLTRTNATKGIVWITFTPLLGMSQVVMRFLQEESPDRADINMTIEDVGHYSREDIERIVASYPEHEREARAKGIPILGSGRIFPIAEKDIVVEPFQIPDVWPQICGLDFGWDHPAAGAWLAWDRDNDIIYLHDSYRMRESTPKDQADIILQKGAWIPVAWPHDGLQTEKGSGFQLAQQYRDAGVNMLHEMAQMPETGDENGHKVSRVSVEASVLEMLNRMKTGRWKVFSNQLDWLSEFRLYHRKDGKIVKLNDDLISASRYAMMMLRYAVTPPDPTMNAVNPRRDYDWRAG
jgi:phage terminase large subunit-like protein